MDNISEQVLAQGIRTLRGGSGPLVVLLPGWPQTAEAYDDLFPMLTAQHQVLALDPPGLGESAPSLEGYDTARISRTLAAAVEGVAEGPYHLVGHDVGAWIAYAWAAQFPERLKSLTLLDSAVPGCSAPRTFPLPLRPQCQALAVLVQHAAGATGNPDPRAGTRAIRLVVSA